MNKKRFGILFLFVLVFLFFTCNNDPEDTVEVRTKAPKLDAILTNGLIIHYPLTLFGDEDGGKDYGLLPRDRVTTFAQELTDEEKFDPAKPNKGTQDSNEETMYIRSIKARQASYVNALSSFGRELKFNEIADDPSVFAAWDLANRDPDWERNVYELLPQSEAHWFGVFMGREWADRPADYIPASALPDALTASIWMKPIDISQNFNIGTEDTPSYLPQSLFGLQWFSETWNDMRDWLVFNDGYLEWGWGGNARPFTGFHPSDIKTLDPFTGQAVPNPRAVKLNGKWTHVLVRLNGETAELFIDGKYIGYAATWDEEWLDSESKRFDVRIPRLDMVSIGGFTSTTSAFYGKLADFRVYNRALTNKEITAVYKEGAW